MSEGDTPDPVLAKLGELLTIIRGSRADNMSIAELASAAGVDVKTIRSFEYGHSWPQDKKRRLVESALGLRPGWLADARKAIAAGKTIPSPFVHTLGHWLNRYAGGPHIGNATTETHWESTKIRLGQQCQDNDVLGGIWPTSGGDEGHPQPDSSPAEPAPPHAGAHRPAPQLSLPTFYGMNSMMSGFPQLMPQGITQPFQGITQPFQSLPPRPLTGPSSSPLGLAATSHAEAAAHHQLIAERERLIGSMMEVVRETTDRATQIATQIVNNAEQSRRQQATATLAAISDLNSILAELHALAASAEPEPLAFKLRTLHDRAFVTVNALASSCAAPSVGRELTNAERVELAAELAAQFMAAVQQRGQEMTRADAFNLALTAIRDMPAATDLHQDRVAEILKDPTSHGLNIQEHLDRWSADREPLPPRVPDDEPCPPVTESDE